MEVEEEARRLKGIKMGALAGAARHLVTHLPVITLLAAFGCGGEPTGGKPNAGKPAPKAVVRNTGSDTMVNLAQMWAEEYKQASPDVSVEVSGGGSGVGIRDLAQGIVDIANSSREITASERAQALTNTGQTPREWIVGYDAIAIYVHRDSPIQEITFEQLAGIFGKGGNIERWSQLGVATKKDRIIRASRMNNSGTYVYFREHVLAKQDFKLGALGMSGSKEVVELVGQTPGAIGYSGMGYKTGAVKFVSVAAKAGARAHAPTFENVRDRKYALARSLLMYTLGEPQGETRKYLDWILSAAGQEVVKQAGYIPVSAGQGQ